MVLLKGEVYFSTVFACLIIFSSRLVFIMHMHKSLKGHGVAVRLWEVPPYRDDLIDIVERYPNRFRKTLQPSDSDYLLTFKCTRNILRHVVVTFFFFFVYGVDRFVSNYSYHFKHVKQTSCHNRRFFIKCSDFAGAEKVKTVLDDWIVWTGSSLCLHFTSFLPQDKW